MTNDENKTGSECPKCKKGRIALMWGRFDTVTLDSEPYTEGLNEGDCETIQLQDYISVSVHACDACGYVFWSNIE